MSLAVPGLEALDLAGKRVLVRVDFNVPLDGGTITDDTRIRKALPTLRAILDGGGLPVLMTHLGRPKAGPQDDLRLGPVAERLSQLLERPVLKAQDCVGDAAEGTVAAASAQGAVALLENVRFHAEETKGDADFAAALARSGDVFVNDAFGTSHRDHASVCGVARLLPSAAGRLLQAEIDAFRRVLEDPERPLVAVLGGAKVSDKLSVVANLIDRVDAILIGGGMAYTFLVAKGEAVGTSLVEHDRVDDVRGYLERAQQRGCRLLLPEDHVVAPAFAADAEARTVEQIPEGWMGLDIGPATRERYAKEIHGARTLVWNGPMGVFEWERFRAGSEADGRAAAECPGYTVVGGGDSVAAIELLEGKVLPGIAVLQG